MRHALLILLISAVALPARAEHPSNGWIVWASSRNDARHEIYRARADGSEVTRLTFSGARYPSWSPDGRWIAYETVPGGRTRVMRWDGSEDKEISTSRPRFWLWDSSRVVVIDSNDRLHKVDPDTGASTAWVRKSDFSAFGSKKWSPSGLTADGRWLVTWTDLYRNGFDGTNGNFTSYHSAVVLDMNDKSKVFFFGRGCEPTTPPSGNWLYHVCGGTYTNPSGQQVSDCQWHPDIFKMKVTDRSSRSSYQAEMEHPDDEFGHEYFPRISNDGTWLVYGATTDGCHDHETCDYEIFIHRVAAGSSNRERLTFNAKNDQWPHLYVGELWSSAPASIELSPTSLSFSSIEGGSNPSAKTVAVTNSGSGTLATVQTSESKSWLTVARSGSGNNQTLTNSINTSGLTAGSYSGTVSVSASNATSSKTYTVSLSVAEATPSVSVSPASLSFASRAGGDNPGSKEISVSNAGGGTLATVVVDESAAWLEVNRSGSGNAQTLTNSVDLAGLAEGTYDTTVDVSASGAGSASYTVTLVLSEELLLASIEVSTAASHILAGQSTGVTASARDQYGDPFPAEITWVATGGTMSPSASDGAVTEHDSTFTSDGTGGAMTVVAASGPIEGSVVINVEAIAIPLRINCGSNELAVDGWMADDAVVTGGSDWTNPNDVSTDGVANAAPAYVYKSVRHESPHSYDIPVPDGEYILRLHFADAYGDRAMTYVVEGESVLSDFDPVTAAGGANIAVVQELAITVSGGLQIDASGAGDVFEAGIEVLPLPNESPLVDAGSDKSIVAGESAHLDGVVDDDSSVVTIAWSVDLGPGEVTFDDAAAALTTATFSEPGYYVLRLSADDGELSGSDTMSVTVSTPDDEGGEPAGDVDDPVTDLDGGVVIEGSCALNATGRAPVTTLLVLVLWRVRRRRH